MKLGWYLARLRNMSAAEIAHRGIEAGKRLQSRRRQYGWARFADGRMPQPLPGLREALLAAAAQHETIHQATASILDGNFTALGVDWPKRISMDLFPASLWTLSPETGKSWPDGSTYCFDIDFRQIEAVGDVKYAWEINRLQFLQALAAAVALGDDARALPAIEGAIASWFVANPPFGGIGWASGIEVALRAISLTLVVSYCGAQLSAGTLGQIGAILRASRYWLGRFPSHYSSANNHLIAELAGLYLITVALGSDAGWVQREIEQQVLLQILPDGVGAEQTPTYAAFTAELALLCMQVGRNGGGPFQPAAIVRLGAFADWVFWLMSPDGAVAKIGDDDEGRALTLCQPEPFYAALVAVAIRGFLRQPAPLPAGGELRNAVFAYPTGLEVLPDGARTFAEGGYSVWHGAHAGHDLHVIFDHGPLGYLSIAAHGHADALALLVVVDGQPLLVDPGTYRYQGGGAWRTWFRSTAAHNTLTVNGVSQSVAAGAFNWSRKASSRLETVERPWRVTASHDGYLARFSVTHRRSVALTDDGLTIIDRLDGASAQPSELTFQLAADLSTAVSGNVVSVTRAGTMVAQLILPTASVVVIRGGEVENGGWVSTRFGSKDAADRIVWSGSVGADGVTTILRLL